VGVIGGKASSSAMLVARVLLGLKFCLKTPWASVVCYTTTHLENELDQIIRESVQACGYGTVVFYFLFRDWGLGVESTSA